MTSERHPAAGRRSSRGLGLAFALWLLAMGAGLGALWLYGATPATEGRPAAVWPAVALARDPHRAAVVVFLHPRCACTPATLDELALALAAAPGAVLHAVLVVPPGLPAGWGEGTNARQARALPRARLTVDAGGTLAAAFGATTSGEVFLYAGNATLRFHGGVTAARGHRGDNPGRAALTALLGSEVAMPARAPVFGCPLLTGVRQPQDLCLP